MLCCAQIIVHKAFLFTKVLVYSAVQRPQKGTNKNLILKLTCTQRKWTMPGLNPGLRNSVSDPGFMSVSALLRQPFSPSNRVARYIYSQYCCYHTNIHSSSTGTPTHSPGEETLYSYLANPWKVPTR